MKHAEAIRDLAQAAAEDDLAVCSLGINWDEWEHHRPSEANFFNSAMGSNVPLALGLAIALPHRRVILLDTDGCVLMTLGALCNLGSQQPPNLHVFIFDNEQYHVTGGQPSATAGTADLAAIARGAGIAQAVQLDDSESFRDYCAEEFSRPGMSFAVVKVEVDPLVRREHREDYVENKYTFVRYIERSESVRILGR